MKIMVLNGSPKRQNSDVMHLTNSFLQGMNDVSQNEISIVNAVDCNVKYCTGCFHCMRSGDGCVINDDMKDILQQMLQSDLLLFSFPLYCYGMPAPLKAIIDRILPLSSMEMQKVGERYEHVGKGDYSHLKYLMMCGCGFPNSKHNFEAAVTQFKLLFPANHTIITVPETPMLNVPEAEAVTKPRLQVVREGGRQYAKSGKIDDELLQAICSPMIPEEIYADIVNGQKG